MKTKVYLILQILLISLIFLSIGHAFYQSSLPPEESAEESGKVGEIIEEIIPPDTKPGEYVQKNLRKIAHFTEFLFLGLWTSLYVVFFLRNKYALSLIFPFGMTIAVLDETVQIFSNRGPSVTDVWIDFFGYSVALAAVLGSFYAAVLVKRIVRAKREGRVG